MTLVKPVTPTGRFVAGLTQPKLPLASTGQRQPLKARCVPLGQSCCAAGKRLSGMGAKRNCPPKPRFAQLLVFAYWSATAVGMMMGSTRPRSPRDAVVGAFAAVTAPKSGLVGVTLPTSRLKLVRRQTFSPPVL